MLHSIQHQSANQHKTQTNGQANEQHDSRSKGEWVSTNGFHRWIPGPFCIPSHERYESI